nr:cysteine-rich receptor-like protein kinase 2 [Ipomoea batatas]
MAVLSERFPNMVFLPLRGATARSLEIKAHGFASAMMKPLDLKTSPEFVPALLSRSSYAFTGNSSTGYAQTTTFLHQGFFRRLNASFADLRSQLSDGEKRFATTQQPAYVMVQCRNYLSTADCVACYDAAVSAIRSCNAANGGRVIFDGCFLRYESNNFYDQTTLPGNVEICGNRTVRQQDAFNTSVEQLLNELLIATPRINGFYAAAKQGESGGGATTYAVAQCAETVSESGCRDCLAVASKNIQGCLPKFADGRAVDAGCFLRYSDTAFFADNQTTDITPFLGGGSSSGKKKAIIGGVVGGVGLILVLGAIFLLYQRSRKPKAAKRGNILGATELRGPEPYRYKDLRAATKDFSDETKLGEGGFGDVYKGMLKNGDVVAVKKLAKISSRVKADFETEVRLITNVHHRNLIRLLGCSAKGEELLLAWKLYENDEHLELVDESLDPNEYNPEEVKRILEIALKCTQSPSNLRPSMSEVVVMLSSDGSIMQTPPSRPTIIDFEKRVPVDTSTTTASSASNATATFSEFTGNLFKGSVGVFGGPLEVVGPLISYNNLSGVFGHFALLVSCSKII